MAVDRERDSVSMPLVGHWLPIRADRPDKRASRGVEHPVPEEAYAVPRILRELRPFRRHRRADPNHPGLEHEAAAALVLEGEIVSKTLEVAALGIYADGEPAVQKIAPKTSFKFSGI